MSKNEISEILFSEGIWVFSYAVKCSNTKNGKIEWLA
uniref:Uncharacterized protein n=1 Tax=viral metagenome TaxID=1070528 RepID=A0A6C0C3A2_9ZZZZ